MVQGVTRVLCWGVVASWASVSDPEWYLRICCNSTCHSHHPQSCSQCGETQSQQLGLWLRTSQEAHIWGLCSGVQLLPPQRLLSLECRKGGDALLPKRCGLPSKDG